MAKYAGLVGYATQEEVSPGVWEDVIITRRMRGDILRATTSNQTSDNIHDEVTFNNRFSLIGDPYSKAHFQDMRFIHYAGRLWKVDSVELQHPRLIVEIGGRYNGPTEPTKAP